MSRLAALLGTNSGLVLPAAIVAAGALGAGLYVAFQSETADDAGIVEVAQPPQDISAETPTTTVTADSSAVETEAASTPEVAAVEAPTDESTPPANEDTPQPPSIDEVRVEADGIFVVAGRALPGSTVSVLLDGLENTSTQTSASGSFAAVSIIAPSLKAQVLTVVQRGADGDVESADGIVLAPVTVPTPEPEVAQAEVPDVQGSPAETETAAATPVPSNEAETATPAASTEVVAAADPETEPADENATPAAETSEPQTETEEEAPARVAILKTTEEGVELVNPAMAPEVMSNVALDTISYSDAGDVQLAGRAQSKAEAVRIYLDNSAIAELTVDAAGQWRGDLPDVDTGIYTLRVDEVNAEGAVTSRVETPFKRESPEVLSDALGEDTAPAKAITVQAGATLWAIARERYGEGTLYVRVFEANKASIRNPDLIYPGQIFELPE